MDVEDLMQRIPPIEKILGVVWIISWVCAIWIYHLQFFLTGLFCLFLILIILGVFDKKDQTSTNLPIVLSMDKNTKTLTVQKIYEEGLKWDDNEICSGTAMLPKGIIKEGDVIKNCDGNVAFRHIPTNKLLGAYDFKKNK